MTMDGERWAKLRRVFEEAIERFPSDRAAFLETACGDDVEFRREVDALLAADEIGDKTQHFLADHPAQGFLAPDAHRSLVGQRVADFEIRGVIGSGGMGTVYDAEQEHPKRRVALKVMRRGLQGVTAMRRFRFESETLGRLQHAGIARVYAAGTWRDVDGREVPYFAMELVEGARDLLEFVDARKLSARDCVQLMTRICDAVHHGHMRGVIHRDLKPANILVDANGAPKIIDFGIARCADTDEEAVTLQTQVGTVLGTLHYMSPEQVSGRRDEIDIRSDVYALGVILFELLTRRLPFDLRGRTIMEAARIVCEQDPPTIGQLDRTLRGDLSVIVDKAIARERERRYASAADFARDLQHFLEDRPIEAVPPSTLYQLGKFARRNTSLVVGASMFVAMLIFGVIVVSLQNVAIEDEARTAVIEKQKALAVSRFLGGILGEAEAVSGKGPDYTVRQALDAASARIGIEIVDQPEIEAEIRRVVGRTYTQLSLFDRAEPHLVRSLALAREGGRTGDVFPALLEMARLRRHQDRLVDAAGLAAEATRLGEEEFGSADPRTLGAAHEWGRFSRESADYAAAGERLAATLERRSEVLGERHLDTVATRFEYGLCLLEDGFDDRAAGLIKSVWIDRERGLGRKHVDTLIACSAWGRVLRIRRDFVESERCLREAFEGLLARLGAKHRYTLDAAFQLAWNLSEVGRLKECLSLGKPTLATCESVLGEAHQHTQTLRRIVGVAYLNLGESEKALALQRRVHQIALRTKGAGHRETLQAALDLAFALEEKGEVDAALELLAECSATELGSQGSFEFQNMMMKGLCLIRKREFDAAEDVLLRTLEVARRVRGPESSEARGVVQCLMRLYSASGDTVKAAAQEAEVKRIDSVVQK